MVENNNNTGVDEALLRQHAIQLFGGDCGGHMARWVYEDLQRGGDLSSGSQLWTSWVDAAQAGRNNYYLTQQEVNLINLDTTQQAITRLFGKSAHSVVDFGAGSAYAVNNKAMPIVRILSNGKNYSPLDRSDLMLRDATGAANDNLQGFERKITVSPLHADFSSGRKPPGGDTSIHFENEDENRLGLFLGSTVTNQEMDLEDEFPREIIVENLKELGRILNNYREDGLTGKHGLIVGYDSNLDAETACNAYMDPDDGPKIWAPLITGVMFDIKKILDPKSLNGGTNGFNPQGWHHEKVFRDGPPLKSDDPDSLPAWVVVHQCVVADEDQSFTITDSNGGERKFRVKEGDRFVIKNNFKFHPQFFRQLAREAGFNPTNDHIASHDTDNTAVLQPLHVTPEVNL